MSIDRLPAYQQHGCSPLHALRLELLVAQPRRCAQYTRYVLLVQYLTKSSDAVQDSRWSCSFEEEGRNFRDGRLCCSDKSCEWSEIDMIRRKWPSTQLDKIGQDGAVIRRLPKIVMLLQRLPCCQIGVVSSRASP